MKVLRVISRALRVMVIPVLAFTGTDLWAQEDVTTTSDPASTGGGSLSFTVGAKAGFNLNQFEQPGSIFGLNAGAFARYEVLDFLQVQLEALYSQQGGGREGYFREYADFFVFNGFNVRGKEVYNRSIRFHLVDVPVIARLTLPELKGSFVTPRLIVGGAYGFSFATYEHRDEILLYDSNIPDVGEVDANAIVFSNQRENVGADYIPHQFGAIVGIALDFNTPSKQFFLEFRYRQGLNQLGEQEFSVLNNGPSGGRVRTSTFSINFGMSILDLSF